MMFLSFSVLVTNYLFGTGSRWIVLLLAAGSALALALVAHADGQMVATARADLAAQGVLARGHGGGLRGRAPSPFGPDRVDGWAGSPPATSRRTGRPTR